MHALAQHHLDWIISCRVNAGLSQLVVTRGAGAALMAAAAAIAASAGLQQTLGRQTERLSARLGRGACANQWLSRQNTLANHSASWWSRDQWWSLWGRLAYTRDFLAAKCFQETELLDILITEHNTMITITHHRCSTLYTACYFSYSLILSFTNTVYIAWWCMTMGRQPWHFLAPLARRTPTSATRNYVPDTLQK